MKTIRSFFAIPVTPLVRHHASDIISKIKEKYQGHAVRWVALENLHITVCFLGQLELTLISHLIARVKEKLTKIHPFELVLEHPQLFPSTTQPRVISLNIATNDTLLNLVQLVHQGVSEMGFSPETRPYRPHLTLARINSRQLDIALSTHHHPAITLPVNSLILYGSQLSAKGSQYTPLAEISLNPPYLT